MQPQSQQQHQQASRTFNFGQALTSTQTHLLEHEILFTNNNINNINYGGANNNYLTTSNTVNYNNYHDNNNQDHHYYQTAEIVDINNTAAQPLQAQPHVTANNYQYHQDCVQYTGFENQQTNENINNNNNNRDSITLALEEISAILNGKEFDDLSSTTPTATTTNTINQQQTVANNLLGYQTGVSTARFRIKEEKLESTTRNSNNNTSNNNNSCNNNNNHHHLNFVETPATIYENLKKSIIGSDVEVGTDYPSTKKTTTMSTNSNKMTDNNHHDLFTRCVANDDIHGTSAKPYVEIIEQPAKCALRFRYKCEGRSAGSLPGINSTSDTKTYPTIRINNYVGRAVVVISCVTKDAPYKAHPHNIVGKEGCKKGICTIVLNNNNSGNDGDEDNDNDNETTGHRTSTSITRSLNGLGIQCVKRKDIEESLSLRESINVDPFRNGFSHKLDTTNIDLNVVRLCFQVFIEGTTPNKCDTPLMPIVSDPIHDKKAMSDLVITKLSHCSAPATGGREVILLCDRISKDDIQIRFFEERDGKLIWETFSEVSPADVHKQVAICLRTPKYYNENITQPVIARIQLRRISDNQVSEPRLFQFLPCESDEDIIMRKRQKVEWVNMNHYASSGCG